MAARVLMMNWLEGGISNFSGEGGVKHVDMQMGEEDLFQVVLGGVYSIFMGEGIGRAHGSAQGMVPY